MTRCLLDLPREHSFRFFDACIFHTPAEHAALLEKLPDWQERLQNIVRSILIQRKIHQKAKNGFLQNCGSLIFLFTLLSNSFLLPTCRPPVRLPVVLEIAHPNSKAEMSPEMEYRWKINTRCRPPKFGSTTMIHR